MSRSRPINRRPFRRPPWRKSSRPYRWISLNSGGASNADGVLSATPWSLLPVASAGQPPNIVLAAGQSDVEPWADNQEIRVDRIVGDLNIRGAVSHTFVSPVDVPLAPPMYIRLGLIVQEEGDATTAPFINLFSDEHLEDFEWMWLYSSCAQGWNYIPYADADLYNRSGIGFQFRIPMDLRVRRKLGQTDTLLLYAQYATEENLSVASTDVVVSGDHVLRSVFVSK